MPSSPAVDMDWLAPPRSRSPETAFALFAVENGFTRALAPESANFAPLAIVIGLFVKQADETLTVHAPYGTVMPANAPES